MSFGLIKRFKDLKKTPESGVKKTFSQHVIIGGDLGAILKLVELRKNHSAEQVRLISNKPLSRKNLEEEFRQSISLIRSLGSVEALYRKHFNAKLLPFKGESVFYKDGKFHDFNGRAKSMELQGNELFFTSKGYDYEIESFFQSEDWEKLDELIQSSQEMKIFESITKAGAPTDLVEKEEWILTFKDFSEISCENLYVSMAPHKFLNLIGNKNDLDASLIDFCSSTDSLAAMNVSFELSKDFSMASQTIFVPQSMTHEWGHFLVEFKDFVHSTKSATCNVLFLVKEEEPQAEDLGAKIKLMKRVLDRVFPDFEKSIKSEAIRFDDDMFIQGARIESLLEVMSKFPTLEFLGQSKLVEESLINEQYLTRTLL